MKQVIFVGDAALGVPKFRIHLSFWADEGVRPYKSIFLIYKIEFRGLTAAVLDKTLPLLYNN